MILRGNDGKFLPKAVEGGPLLSRQVVRSRGDFMANSGKGQGRGQKEIRRVSGSDTAYRTSRYGVSLPKARRRACAPERTRAYACACMHICARMRTCACTCLVLW